MGYVDIHCHLLWGIDDGCRRAEDALEAARVLESLGYTDVAPSPHARADFPSQDGALCEARFSELRQLFQREAVGLSVHRNAENHLDEAFFERLARGEPRALGESGRYVLVELPFMGSVPALPDLVFRVRLKGLSPVIAHPERCAEFDRPGRAAEMVRLGASLQLDLGALTGRYGREARRRAERFLDEGFYAAAATDLHDPAGARGWISQALATLEKRAGRVELTRLCQENPRRAVAGEELT